MINPDSGALNFAPMTGFLMTEPPRMHFHKLLIAKRLDVSLFLKGVDPIVDIFKRTRSIASY